MNVRVKWSLARAKAKLRRWERQVDKETVESLREYGAVAATAMVKCTPPAHRGTTPTKALAALKQRIKDDISKYLYSQTKRKPMVLPIVMYV